MARLYANENMDLEVVEILRSFNHDVLITFEAGKANQGEAQIEQLGVVRAPFLNLHFQLRLYALRVQNAV